MKFDVPSESSFDKPSGLLTWDKVVFDDGEEKAFKSVTMYMDAGNTVLIEAELDKPEMIATKSGSSVVTKKKQYVVPKDRLPEFAIPLVEHF